MQVEIIHFFGEGEAAVTVTDGTNTCVAFAHPCEVEVGAILTRPLSALDTGAVMRSVARQPSATAQKSLGPFNYWIVGRVTDREAGVVSIGELRISGVLLPGDVRDGELVEFAVSRLDVC